MGEEQERAGLYDPIAELAQLHKEHASLQEMHRVQMHNLMILSERDRAHVREVQRLDTLLRFAETPADAEASAEPCTTRRQPWPNVGAPDA